MIILILLIKNNESSISTNSTKEVFVLNVGGKLMYTTRDTLTYIPNTLLSSIFTQEKQSHLIQRDNNGRIFLDLPSNLFEHALHQIRRWNIRANRTANLYLSPPSWNVKQEFDEMLVALRLGKYRQGNNHFFFLFCVYKICII